MLYIFRENIATIGLNPPCSPAPQVQMWFFEDDNEIDESNR